MLRTTILAAGILGGASPVLAQSAAPPTFRDRLTVTASLVEEPARGVPASVEVVDRAELEDRKALLALELLRTFVGLDTARSGGVGKLASAFVRGTNSSHLLVLRDGVALNDPFLGGFDHSTLSLEGIERVELVRGPFSALYGSPALGGVLNLVTRPGAAPFGRLRVEAGEDGHRNLGGSGSLFEGRVRLRPAAQLVRTDGTLRNDFHKASEASLGLDLNLGRPWEIRPSVNWYDGETGLPIGFGGQPTPRRTQFFKRQAVALPAAWTGQQLAGEGQVAGLRTDLSVRDRDNPFGASDAEGEREQARAFLRGRIGPRFEWAAGGEFQRDQVESANAFGPGLQGQRQRHWGAFVQGSLRTDRFRADLGVRRDEVSTFGGETSLRLGTAYRLTDSSRLRFGFGEAFRAPSLADLFFPGFSNPDLEPERVRASELAWEWSGGGVTLEAIGFYQDLVNLIEFDFVTFRPRNLGAARVKGVEVVAAYRGGPIEGRLAATWQDAQDERTGRALLRRADFKASALILLRQERWTAGASFRHVGERFDFGNIPLEPYSLVDLTAAVRIGERWEPYLRVLNLADDSYEEIAGYPAPGRQVQAGCAVRF